MLFEIPESILLYLKAIRPTETTGEKTLHPTFPEVPAVAVGGFGGFGGFFGPMAQNLAANFRSQYGNESKI